VSCARRPLFSIQIWRRVAVLDRRRAFCHLQSPPVASALTALRAIVRLARLPKAPLNSVPLSVQSANGGGWIDKTSRRPKAVPIAVLSGRDSKPAFSLQSPVLPCESSASRVFSFGARPQRVEWGDVVDIGGRNPPNVVVLGPSQCCGPYRHREQADDSRGLQSECKSWESP
jgi:hypothetical protein